MTWLVQPRLINGPFDDPGLFLDLRFARRALLFDLGDLGPLAAREVMRVGHVFVSHTHMDHFAGFDRLLRLCLHRSGPLVLTGPPDFVGQVERRIHSYTWNLVGEGSPDCVVEAREFDGERLVRAARFRARRAFAREDGAPPDLGPGLVHAEDAFVIEAVALDHGIPSLAFALRERMRVNVRTDGLAALGVPVGPWLNEAKRAVRRGDPDETPIPVGGGASLPLGEIRRHGLTLGPGQAVAYVVDAAPTEANAARIRHLARDADLIFIEAAFLEEDAAVAAERRHLTAALAGRLAREAGARRLVPLHHSPRYLDRPDALRDEALAAFAGERPP